MTNPTRVVAASEYVIQKVLEATKWAIRTRRRRVKDSRRQSNEGRPGRIATGGPAWTLTIADLTHGRLQTVSCHVPPRRLVISRAHKPWDRRQRCRALQTYTDRCRL